MKAKMRGFALVACAVALCCALIGCSNGEASKEDAKAAFVGSWKLTALTADGEDMSGDDISMLDAFGMSVGLVVADDGTCSFTLFGETMDGTWEAASTSEAKFMFEGETLAASLADGKLSMTADGDAMTFERRSESASAGAAGTSAANGANTASGSNAAATAEGSIAVDKVLADDEFCTIVCMNKKTDWAGDAGYTFKLVNKTADQTLTYTSSSGLFSVDGKMVDFILSETVKPGMTAETFGYIGKEQVASLDDLKNVEGTIEVYNYDTYDTVSKYDVHID